VVLPTSSISRVRTHFCTDVARTYGGVTSPRKKGLNGTMPAFTNNKFGSSAINDADGTTVCFKPCEFSLSKKRSQRERISADSN